MDSLGATNGAVDIVPGLTRSVHKGALQMVCFKALSVEILAVLALQGAKEWMLQTR